MQEYLTSDAFNAEIIMLAQANLVLVAEGRDDYQLLKRHVSSKIIFKHGNSGKPALLELSAILYKKNIDFVRFLLDRDFDDILLPKNDPVELTVFSQNHDLFMDLFFSCSDPIVELFDHTISKRWTKLPDYLKTDDTPRLCREMLEKALQYSSHIGIMRACSQRVGANFPFEKFPYKEYLEYRESEASIGDVTSTMLDLLGSRSNNVIPEIHSVQTNQLVAEYSPDLHENRNKFTGDHDLIRVLSILFKKTGIGDVQVRGAVATGIPCSSIIAQSWYLSITDWAKKYGVQAFGCTESTRCSL